MDRTLACEAGNLGSTPNERTQDTKTTAHSQQKGCRQMKILEAEGGTHFNDFVKRAIATVKRRKGKVFVIFNGIVFWIKPGDNIDAVSGRYHREVKRRDKQFLESQNRKRR